MSLPTFAYLTNPDGSQSYTFSGEWAKTITPEFQISIFDTFTHQTNPSVNGWQNFRTGLKYQAITNAEHEFLISVGVEFEWGHTGNASVGAAPFTTWSPQLYFGKGFGDLPMEFNVLRPFAVTGQFGVAFPTQAIIVNGVTQDQFGNNITSITNNPTVVNWGFTLQYSLPYMNSNVSAIDVEFFRHLIPLVEVNFQSPVANIGPLPPAGVGNSHITTGLVGPGIVYASRYYQLAVEALIPINSQSGKHIGVIANLDLYLDDLLPDSLGRPLFASAGYQAARSPFGQVYATGGAAEGGMSR